jgi:hypothetical protein
MPKNDIGNLRVLLENETDGPKKVFFCPMLAASISQDKMSPEHIFPEALGKNTWQIALSRQENEGFSKRFEQKFLSQPWIIFGKQLNEFNGRRKSKENVIDGYARDSDSDKLNKLSIRDGIPEVNVIDKRSRISLLDNAPIEMRDNDELCVHQIPTPVPTILEATKIAFEQLHWHKDTQVSNLQVVKLMREILLIKDVHTPECLRPYRKAKTFGYTIFVNFPDPNPRTEDKKNFTIWIKFTDYHVPPVIKKQPIDKRIRVNKKQHYIDQLFKDWQQDQITREQNTHSFKLQIFPKNEFNPRRLEFHFDFAHTTGGIIWFRLEPTDVAVLGKTFSVTNLLPWNKGQ